MSNKRDGVLRVTAAADVAAVTSRSTPSSWSRISSALWKRSSGCGAVPFSSQRYSESCWAKIGTSVGLRQRRLERALVALELEDQHGQRARHRVQVAGDRRALLGDLGRLEADGAVDRRLVVVDPAHATEVDQLQAVADLDDVGRLEVAVQQAEQVQVAERRQDLDDVGDGLIDRDRREPARSAFIRSLRMMFSERPPTYSMTMYERAVGGGDEVVDLDDQRVLDLGQVLLLGHGGPRRVGVAGVQQTLEHHPAIVDVAIVGEVDPAHPAVGEAADHFVLTADERAGLQLRVEVERRAALRAEALRPSRRALARPTDRCAAHRAEALVLGDRRRVHQRLPRIGDRHRRHLGEAGAEARRLRRCGQAPSRPAGTAGTRRTERHLAEAGRARPAGDGTRRVGRRTAPDGLRRTSRLRGARPHTSQ